LRYSPDGTRIATLGFGKHGIDVWDAASYQQQATRTRPWSRARTVDGPIARLQNVPVDTDQMQFGGCSHVLVTGAPYDVIRVWDAVSGTLTGICETAPGTKWAGGGRRTLGDGSGRIALTSCHDGTLRVWDVTTGQERTRLPTPPGFRIGAVNSDATKLATSDGGKSVEIWSIAGGPGQQPAPDAAAPDNWCPRCGAGWPQGPPPDKASGRS
jgi:WD40 repeat protein